MATVRIAGHDVVFASVLIPWGDRCGVDIEFSYGGKDRWLAVQFDAAWNGPAGVWVHNFPNRTSILFAGWGGATETILNPPVRFCDLDGQRFEMAVAHRKIGEAHRAAVQIVAVPQNYAGPYTVPLYGSDQPHHLRIS